MGTFVKDEKLTEASLGTKTVYKIDNFEHLENSQQYYLEGSENDGWKVIFQNLCPCITSIYLIKKMLLSMETHRLVC